MQGFFISQKWSSNFGFDDDEVNFLNYMTKKNFVLAMRDTKENYEETCTTEELLELFKDMKETTHFKNVKLFIGKKYYFQDRMFCHENKSLEYFISKVKKYYANKIKHYKSIKSLSYRRLHGKYPRYV